MRRSLLAGVLSFCLSLIATAAVVLLRPVPAYALATCRATCYYTTKRVVVECTGVRCNATDNWGCSYQDEDGRWHQQGCPGDPNDL